MIAFHSYTILCMNRNPFYTLFQTVVVKGTCARVSAEAHCSLAVDVNTTAINLEGGHSCGIPVGGSAFEAAVAQQTAQAAAAAAEAEGKDGSAQQTAQAAAAAGAEEKDGGAQPRAQAASGAAPASTSAAAATEEKGGIAHSALTQNADADEDAGTNADAGAVINADADTEASDDQREAKIRGTDEVALHNHQTSSQSGPETASTMTVIGWQASSASEESCRLPNMGPLLPVWRQVASVLAPMFHPVRADSSSLPTPSSFCVSHFRLVSGLMCCTPDVFCLWPVLGAVWKRVK